MRCIGLQKLAHFGTVSVPELCQIFFCMCLAESTSVAVNGDATLVNVNAFEYDAGVLIHLAHSAFKEYR